MSAAATHLISFGFDDGFRRSSLATAEIFERHGLRASFNVIATGHHADFVAPDAHNHHGSKGDFALWNELIARGHEVMPHGYRHANKGSLPLAEAQDLVERCLAVFAREVPDFTAGRAVFNLPYNASSPALDAWLATRVRAFRVGSADGRNPMPRPGLARLVCTCTGPGNGDDYLDQSLERFLAGPPGWLIYGWHGLDDEGWGPLSAAGLDRALAGLAGRKDVQVVPTGQALAAADAAGVPATRDARGT